MRRITPSMVVAMVAVVFACSGGAYATSVFVTSKQIKDGTIKGKDIAEATIGPSRLSTGVQDTLDAAPTPGPIGPAGPAGVAGPVGPTGATGAAGATGPAGIAGVTRVVSPHQSLAPGGFTNNMRVNCPAGMVVVGTGFNAGIGNADFVLSYGTFVGAFLDNDTSITIETWVQALCAPGNDAGGASSLRGGRASAERAFESDEAAARTKGR